MMMMELEISNESSNGSIEDNDFFLNETQFLDDTGHLPLYLRITCLTLFILIFIVGTVGNIMVTLVISRSRDMRTSTNIFLVNLSIADLLVLVICTPTAVIEVTYHPDRWILGFYMCKFVPLLEATVANTSVLTILAISFERYYVICQPFKANYVCTKSRAAMICLAAWVLSTVITSPVTVMTTYSEGINEHGEWTARCGVLLDSTWVEVYTISIIFVFFLAPFFILLVTYGMIAKRLTSDRSALNAKNENHKARKQVVLMLGTVVFTFFLCLLPFRLLTLLVLWVDLENGEAYQNAVYFSRIMIYVNSALNPILYNIISSKFRYGFLNLCSRQRKQTGFTRTGTFITNTTTTNSTNASINLGHHPNLGYGNASGKVNGLYTGHNSLMHTSSVNRNSGSPTSRPDLLRTLIRTQSNASTTTPLSNPISPANSCDHYYNNLHPSGSSFRHHVGSNGTLNVANGGANGIIGRKSQSQFSFNHIGNGTVAINNKASNNILANNGRCCGINGKHMTVKSDSVYSAYLSGKRSETVL